MKAEFNTNGLIEIRPENIAESLALKALIEKAGDLATKCSIYPDAPFKCDWYGVVVAQAGEDLTHAPFRQEVKFDEYGRVVRAHGFETEGMLITFGDVGQKVKVSLGTGCGCEVSIREIERKRYEL